MSACGGQRRYGGAFSLGPVRWEACREKPIVLLTFKQDGKTDTLPACSKCWAECIENGITITKAVPLVEEVT